MKNILYDAINDVEKTHWWYCARREIVLDMIKKYPRNMKIIDFGCGVGAMLESLSTYGEVTGADISAKALDYCRQKFNGQLLQLDLNEKLLLKDKYNLGIAMDVLEHLDDDLAALHNIKDVLPGGDLIITVPAFMFMWSAHDENNLHKRRYTAKSLKKVLTKAGLRIKYLSYYNFWLFPAVAFIRTCLNILKGNKKSEMEHKIGSKPVNCLLFNILRSEIFFISRGIQLPFGVSLIAVVNND